MFGWWRLRRLANQLWHLLPKEIPWPAIDRGAANIELPTVLRAVAPGWANIHVGQRGIGWIYLAGYIVCGLSGLLLMGSPYGGILLGLAFAIHVASIVTALAPRFDSFGNRLIFTAACSFLLGLFVYLPAGALLSRIAAPLSINGNVDPFRPGDVVWYRPTSHVEAGQYVLYNSADTMQGRRYIRAGMRINRVIAVAGQTLTWEDGKLFVDGKLARRSYRPIAKLCFRSWKFLPIQFLWIRRILLPTVRHFGTTWPECQLIG